MAFFKLSDLSEKEKKKYLQSIEDQVNERLEKKETEEKKANQAFNNYYENNNINQNNSNNNVWDKILGVTKSVGNGMLGGIVSVPQAEMQTIANDMKNGKEKGVVSSGIETLEALTNPLASTTKNATKSFISSIKNLTDKEKSVKEKIVNQGLNSVSDAQNMIPIKNIFTKTNELVGNVLSDKAPDVMLNLSDKIAEPYYNNAQKINNELSKYGKGTQLAGQVGETVGRMIPSIATSIITQNPNAGLAVMGAGAKGTATKEALDKGADLEQAVKIGDTSRAIEIGTEMLTGGVNIFGKGALDKIVEKGINSKVKNKVLNYLAKQGAGISGEILEEVISDTLGTLIDRGTIDKDAKYTWEDFGNTAITTMLSTIVLNALGGSYTRNAYNKNIQEMQEYESQQKNQYAQNSGADMQQKIKEKNSEQNNNINNNEINQGNININEDIAPIQNNNNVQMEKIIDQPKQAIKDFNESAKQYNINYNNEDLKEINKMYEKRGITAYFDENTFKNNDNSFSIWKPTYDEQGNIAGREVVVNPNAKDTKTRVQELAIHELGHDLELNEVQNMILKDASRKENWENARKSLEDTYRQAYQNDGIQISEENFSKIVDEEATMSILQRELGSQEYVNRLVNQNQSIAKKIYNWVIDKLNKFTGGKNEKIFWTDIKNKFETAYNQEFNKNDSSLKYSIAGKEALKSIKDKQLSEEAYNSYNKAKQLARDKASNEKIFKETGWYKDKVTGKMKFNFSDKDMQIINQNYKAGQEFKLKDILVHNTLFEMYPQLKDYKVKIEDMNSNNSKTKRKLNGRYNRLTNELTLDINRFKDISNAEGTLIHEIQHAIQKIEGFAGGTSTKFGKEKYQNNPGEIEARDTSTRMIQEKYNKDDLTYSMPKSANVDTSILEKMKIGLYNYLNNINNEEVSNEFNEGNKKKNSSNTSENNELVLGGIDKNNAESENNSGSFSLQKNKQNEYAIPTKDWQQFVENNYQQEGTGKNLKEYKLPIKEVQSKVQENNMSSVDNFSNTRHYIENIPTKEFFENREKQELLTDKDYSVLNDIYEREGKTEILTEKKKAKVLEKYINDKYKFKDSFDELAQKFVNKGHYIDKLSKETKNSELKYIYDRNLNSFAEGQYEVGVAQTNNEGKKIGKSINEIWEPIEKQNLTKEFSEYLLHKHNIDRSERNKYVFNSEIGPAESTAIAMDLEQKHPEFKEYAKDIKKFNHNNLECLVDAGLLSNDMVKYLEEMYPNYVTIARDLQDSIYAGDKNKTGVNAPIKSATGGNADIQPLKDTMAQQAIKIKRLINQNKLGQELSKTLKNAHVEQEGTIQLSPTMLFELDTLVDTDTKGNKYYTYFENGELQKLKIDDNLYESLKPTERSRLEETLPVKALQKVTNLHRSVLTSSNPIFIITNFFKDFQDGMFNSKYSSKFVKNYGKALNEIMTKGEYYETYMANGGMTNTYFDYNEGIKKKSNKFVEKIRNANEIVEQLPRMSEFISTLEDGKSLNEALYNAAEITTNFKRGGDITKAINRNGVNFLNASIQGLDKQFRNFSEQKGAKGYVNLLVKATLMGVVPSVLNHILLDDDKDYEELPESTKDLYYLFKYGDGKFIRIPKGRVLSIFGSAARRTLESIQGDEESWKGFKDTVINQIAPNNPLEDNILAPIMQVKNNKTWYGSDLVSSRLQKELPKNQYDETTDEFSKWLGNKINVSPKKINYLIDQYSGGIGDVVLPIITPQAKQNVIKDKFTTDSVLKNKYVSKFYETLEKQTQIANDPLATDEDEIQLKYLNNASKEMGELYKEKRNVQMSNISNKEKTTKVREIQEKIDELAENTLQNYTNFAKTPNSAKVGDEEYYKNGNGEWTVMNDETKQKNSNISTETYSDYKQKVYQETQKEREEGTLSKNQSLKQKDKIQILLNSKYSDKEKKAIYINYIKNEQDTEYEIMNYANTDINEYLKYKQQEFSSDYKDDETTEGKAISGSKQKKVYEYINSCKMTYEQKLLLIGMQYKLTSGERNILAKYIDALDISSDKKLTAYKKLKGFTVYKNGDVSW